MKILFITVHNPHNKRSWSGTAYNIFQALSKKHNVEWIGDLNINFVRNLSRLKSRFYKLCGKKYKYYNTIAYSKFLSKKVQEKIESRGFDLIFSCSSASEVAFIKTEIPLLYLSDAIFYSLVDYYHEFSGLTAKNVFEGELVEKYVYSKAKYVVFSSKWATDQCIERYNIDASKIHVLKFGANLDKIPMINEIKKVAGVPFKLLFMGVEWRRKGGEIAVDAFKMLKCQGFDVKLYIIGCKYDTIDADIINYPFLDKNKEEDFIILNKIMSDADCFILPTQAECSAIVYCEACAFGLPIITTDTGGTTDYVENDCNGIVLSVNAKPVDYAQAISQLINNPQLWQKYSKNSRVKYENELNWSTWADNFDKVLGS